MFNLEEKLIILDAVARRMYELDGKHPRIELFEIIKNKIIENIQEGN